jgi:site-specific DNA recombinase
MTRKTNQKAVIYCRVSTKKQATEGSGLTSQETRCREYAGHRGHTVVGVFNDDVSGSLANRPGFDAMLAFIRQNRMAKIVVIIDDISRMARDLKNHFNLKEAIFRAGATLESPTVDFGVDSDSQLVENLLASVSQHQRQKNGEQAKNRMRARMQNGFWTFHAPIGYRYKRVPEGGSVLHRVEPLASIIGEGLEAYASGRLNSIAEVRRFFEAHPEFPVTRHGHVTNQQAKRIMTHEIYAGYIQSQVWGVPLRKGHHAPVISLETFQKVQDRLAGKTSQAIVPVRQDVSADFPMRGYVTCGCCGHPLTANWSKGRTKSYAYYLCRNRDCEMNGKSVARDTIEHAYEDMLRDMVPSPALLNLMVRLFKKRWDEAEASARDTRQAMKREIAALEKLITAAVDKMLASDNEAVIAAYERKVETLERQKLVLAERTARCGTILEDGAKDFDAAFRTAFDFLASPWKVWENGSLEARRIVLNLTLGSHLEYDWNSGLRTAELSLPFKVLDSLKSRNSEMAD